MYTVNHQAPGFGGPEIRAALGMSGGFREGQHRVRLRLLFCTSQTHWVTTSCGTTLTCVTQNFIRVFLTQRQSYHVLFHAVPLHSTVNFKF